MAKLGTEQKPAIARVQTPDRAKEIMAKCEEHGWKVIVGIEPGKSEDISDIERLLNPVKPVRTENKVNRNDPCPCGSGRKFKKCCMN